MEKALFTTLLTSTIFTCILLCCASDAFAGARPFLVSAVHFEAELKSGKMSVLDLAPVAVKYGAQGVEYRDIYWKAKAQELPAVREQCSRMKLLVTYTTITTLFSNDERKQAQLLTDIDDAHALGAGLLRVNLGVRPAASKEGDSQRNAAKRAIEHAAHLGVRLALENNSAPPGEQLSDIRATLEDFNTPALGTNVDFANYATTGQDPLKAIQALAPWIIYVHAKDARKTEKGWSTTYLGNGSLPLKEIFAALDATGRLFLLCLEFPGAGDPEEGLARSKAYLAGDN